MLERCNDLIKILMTLQNGVKTDDWLLIEEGLLQATHIRDYLQGKEDDRVYDEMMTARASRVANTTNRP
jgi:hypothetical protein